MLVKSQNVDNLLIHSLYKTVPQEIYFETGMKSILQTKKKKSKQNKRIMWVLYFYAICFFINRKEKDKCFRGYIESLFSTANNSGMTIYFLFTEYRLIVMSGVG